MLVEPLSAKFRNLCTWCVTMWPHKKSGGCKKSIFFNSKIYVKKYILVLEYLSHATTFSCYEYLIWTVQFGKKKTLNSSCFL